MKQRVKIAVLGDGGWGTTLAILLSKKGYQVTLWAFPEYINYLNRKRENKKFLPAMPITEQVYKILYKINLRSLQLKN